MIRVSGLSGVVYWVGVIVTNGRNGRQSATVPSPPNPSPSLHRTPTAGEGGRQSNGIAVETAPTPPPAACTVVGRCSCSAFVLKTPSGVADPNLDGEPPGLPAAGRQRAAPGVSPARKRPTNCRPFRAQRPLQPASPWLSPWATVFRPLRGLDDFKDRGCGSLASGAQAGNASNTCKPKGSRRSSTLSGLLTGGHPHLSLTTKPYVFL